MKVVRINQLDPVQFTGGISFRALTKKDGFGFAMMKTVIPKGGPYKWHYKNHLEACYCIKGKAELTNLVTGIKILIVPDVIYAVEHEPHTFEALEDTVLISVFNPPLKGDESHDENGVYPVSEDGLSKYHKAKEIVEICNGEKTDYDAVEKIVELI
jgi:L-ectoine synthase